MSIEIITNNKPRFVIDACELSPSQREEFDYLDWDVLDRGEDSASFMRYQGQLYDLGEFSTTYGNNDPDFRKWDGYSADTFFSGVLVRYPRDGYGDEVIVGRYYAR